jgi:hypothetical protein
VAEYAADTATHTTTNDAIQRFTIPGESRVPAA